MAERVRGIVRVKKKKTKEKVTQETRKKKEKTEKGKDSE